MVTIYVCSYISWLSFIHRWLRLCCVLLLLLLLLLDSLSSSQRCVSLSEWWWGEYRVLELEWGVPEAMSVL